LLAIPTVLAFSAGGFFDGARLRAGVVVWAGVVVLAFARRHPLPSTRVARVGIGALVLFAAWTTIAVAWSPLRDPGLADAERVWLYAGYLLLAVALLRGPLARAVEPALAAGATLTAAYALATRLLPSLVPSARSLSAGARLDQPLTYWNALGLLMAFAIVLLLRLAAADDRPPALRTTAAALVPVPGLALYLTFSRGSLAALAAGVLVLLLLCRDRRALATVFVCLACAGLTAVATTRFPAVDSLSRGPTAQRNQGLAVLAIVVVACALAAFGQRAIARGAVDRIRVRGRIVAAMVLLTAALAAGGAVALTRNPGPPPVQTPTGPELPTNSSRLTTLKTNRYDYWKVAWHGFTRKPLTGIGTHGFQQLWLERRPIGEYAQDAHSLYIETAAELGLIGLLLLGAVIGAPAVAVARVVRTGPRGRALTAGWIAASAAFLVHAGVDWDWEMPAVTLPFLALAGAALAQADDQRVERDRSKDDQRRLGGDPEAGYPVDGHGDDAHEQREGGERPDRLAPPAQ
jgi:O-Antigen ligase